MTIHLLQITDNKQLTKEFYAFPVRLYANNPYWIRPLDTDIEQLFDPAKNQLFKEGGEAIRWLAVDENNQTLGRIAAFINPRTAQEENQRVGGVGFFESIDHQAVANALFDAAKGWLSERGVSAMDGPINFGERDTWWGLLIDGHAFEPTYGMFYHFEYYQRLFETYGFREYFRQFTFWLPMDESGVKRAVNRRLFERADAIYATEGYRFEHVDPANLPKFTEDFRTVYNQAWANHLSTGEMTRERAKQIMERMKPVMVPELMWFGYYRDQPIAFFISLPELNQVFKHVNGRLNVIGKLKFLYHKLRKTNRKAFGVIFGVVPEFQGKGIESAIAIALTRACWHPDFQYKELELNWIGDFNPKMLTVVRLLGAKPHKTYATYRYLFDRNAPFKRYTLKSTNP